MMLRYFKLRLTEYAWRVFLAFFILVNGGWFVTEQMNRNIHTTFGLVGWRLWGGLALSFLAYWASLVALFGIMLVLLRPLSETTTNE